MSADLYEILGVEPDAEPSEVKAAYRRLALKYHPDQNPGDDRAEDRFKKVTHAYEVLGDREKRRAYDRLRKRRGAGGETGVPFQNFSDLFDVLNSVISAGFGGLARRGSSRRGEDIRVELSVTLEEAMTGVRRDVSVPRPRECERCSGTGAEPGTKLRRCDNCEGKGQVRIQQGLFSLMRDCEDCFGRGRIVDTPCRRCEGAGTIEGSELLPVDVPPGVWNGQTLRWSGKGKTGPDGKSGDLLIDIDVESHELFERDGQDVHLKYPVSFTQASLGAKVEVPTLDGRVRMNVPAGTQSGRVFRLRGKGLPAIGDRGRGDQYVRLRVKSPDEFSRRQEEVRGKYGSTSGSRSGKPKGIWNRVRELFN